MSFRFHSFRFFSFYHFRVVVFWETKDFSVAAAAAFWIFETNFSISLSHSTSLSPFLSSTPTQRTVLLLLLLCAHALQLSCALSSLLSLSHSLTFCNWNTVTTARQNAFWWHEIYDKNSCMPAIVLQQQQQQQQSKDSNNKHKQAQAELAEWHSSQL